MTSFSLVSMVRNEERTTDRSSVALLVMFLAFDVVLTFGSPSPVAAADDEWINGDQQGELFEALAEFSHCRRLSFRYREFHCRDTMGFVLCPM